MELDLDRLTRHRGYIDHVIGTFANVCATKCEPEVNVHDEDCVAHGILLDVKWLIGELRDIELANVLDVSVGVMRRHIPEDDRDAALDRATAAIDAFTPDNEIVATQDFTAADGTEYRGGKPV